MMTKEEYEAMDDKAWQDTFFTWFQRAWATGRGTGRGMQQLAWCAGRARKFGREDILAWIADIATEF